MFCRRKAGQTQLGSAGARGCKKQATLSPSKGDDRCTATGHPRLQRRTATQAMRELELGPLGGRGGIENRRRGVR